jgi:hypothetical protein
VVEICAGEWLVAMGTNDGLCWSCSLRFKMCGSAVSRGGRWRRVVVESLLVFPLTCVDMSGPLSIKGKLCSIFPASANNVNTLGC